MNRLSAWWGRLLRGLLSGPIIVYRVAISPLIGPRCRFLPSCSDYALQAVREHRPAHALVLIARRLARCHPFGSSGLDEVPASLRCGCGAHAQSRSFRFPKDPIDSRPCPPSA